MDNKNILFKQLFESESATYTYLIADKITNEAIIIDPVIETFDRDSKLIKELGLDLKYVLDTHVHADHITSSSKLKEEFGAKIVLNEDSNLDCPDILLKDEEELSFGNFKIKGIKTPGHTDGCMSFLFENFLFTGDTLLIRTCGRTDFQGGSSEKLYDSLSKIYSLDENIIIYPGHDYNGFTSSTILEEKKFNSMLNENISKEKFIENINNLKLDLPKKIHYAVPSNMVCGIKRIEKSIEDFK